MNGFLPIPALEAPSDGFVFSFSGAKGRPAWAALTGASLTGFASGQVAFGSSAGGLTTDSGLTYSTSTGLATSLPITSTVATGTAPLVVASTTQVANLNASLLLGGTWAAPGAIGGTTPAAGAFTTLTANSTLTLTSVGATHTISSTTASSSTTTGALVVSGGVGLNGALNIGGTTTLNSAVSVTPAGTTSNPLVVIGRTGAGSTEANQALRVGNVSSTGKYLCLGYDSTSDYGYIAAINSGTGWLPIQIQPYGNAALTLNGGGGAISLGGATSGAVSIKSTSATAGIGYGTGAGGTVTQATSKSTGVALNTVCGTITLNAASLAANTSVAFTFTNSAIAATDYVDIQHDSVGTLGAYSICITPAAGSATVTVRNNTAGALAEAIVLRFFVTKAVTS